jgi:predicted HTH transcriptional regulator
LKISKSHIESLIEQGEHQQLDFKFAVNDSRKIARSLVAFANTDGGRLLIGVKDNGVIAGVRTVEEYYMVEAAAKIYSKPVIDFKSHEWNLNGKKVLEVIVKPGPERPYYAGSEDGKWYAYQRVADQNILAGGVILEYWRRSRTEKNVFIRYGENEKLFLELVEKRGFVTITEFMEIAGINKSKAEKIVVDFMLLDVVTLDMMEDIAFFKLTTH